MKKIIMIVLPLMILCITAGCQKGESNISTESRSGKSTEIRQDKSAVTWNPYVDSGFYKDIYGEEFMENVHGMIAAMIDHEDAFVVEGDCDWTDVLMIARYLFPPMDEMTGDFEGEDGKISIHYVMSKKEADEFLDEFKDQVEWWINEHVTLDGPDTLKALELYHFMAANVVYDDGSAEELDEEEYENYDVTPCRAIMELQGICQSFSGAYSYLLLQMGIDACSTGGIVGDYLAHEWTLLKLNGKWYYSDVTFENGDGGNGLLYFGMTDEKRYAEGNYPVENYNVGECNQIMGSDFPVNNTDLSDLWNIADVTDISWKDGVVSVSGSDSSGKEITVELQ